MITKQLNKWYPVSGYYGYLEMMYDGVSLTVRSIDRFISVVNPKTNVEFNRRQKSRVIKPNVSKNGYLTVALSKEGESRTTYVHRLIAKNYLPYKEGRDFVNHINGIKQDNRIENIEWCTNAENVKHAWKNGLCQATTRSLSNDTVIELRNKFFNGSRIYKLAEEYGLKRGTVRDAVMFITYKEL